MAKDYFTLKSMKESRSFEEIAKRDTFDDIYAKINILIDEKRYSDARSEISNELNLLARSLGTMTDEERKELRGEFTNFLREDLRWIMGSENAEPLAESHERAEATAADTEEGEALDGESPGELIDRYAKEGWKLVNIAGGADAARAEDGPGKKRRIVGTGKEKLIFERDEEDS